MKQYGSLVDTWYAEGGIRNVLRQFSADVYNALYYLVAVEMVNSTEIYSHGLQFHLGRDMSFFERLKLAVGRFEWRERRFIDDHLPPELDVIELGGGVGFISCVVDRKLNGRRNHVVVEPNPRSSAILHRNRELNGSGFEIEQRAYAPGESTVTLSVEQHLVESSTFTNQGESFTAKTTGLAELRSEHEIGEFALIVDIEGSEASLLEELDIIEKDCRFVIMELHPERNTGVKRVDEALSSIFPVQIRHNPVVVYSTAERNRLQEYVR